LNIETIRKIICGRDYTLVTQLERKTIMRAVERADEVRATATNKAAKASAIYPPAASSRQKSPTGFR
jgi:alpha-tubulin suppressor-like RCC1 family protein